MNDIFKAYDFENEQQWLKGRMNGIGGSDASAVVGMNPYKSNIDLFEEKIGRVIPKDISDKPCVIYGKKAEEYIRELFKLDYPEYKVDHHEFRILQSKDHSFMQASLDGELTDREGRKGILEIKTTNGGAKTLELLEQGKIPEKDLWKYSSFWFKDFDGMALKTMLRQLISKWGIMSIDLQKAIDKDMAVIQEDGSADYVENAADEIDNDNVVAEQEIKEVQPETKEPEPEKGSNQREASDIEAEFFNK